MRRTPSGESERLIALVELLKLQEIGQFPDESVKKEDTHIHHGDTRDVLAKTDIKTIA